MNHRSVSFIKSSVRIVGCVLAVALSRALRSPELGVLILAIYFAFAEGLGILEELKDTRKEEP